MSTGLTPVRFDDERRHGGSLQRVAARLIDTGSDETVQPERVVHDDVDQPVRAGHVVVIGRHLVEAGREVVKRDRQDRSRWR